MSQPTIDSFVGTGKTIRSSHRLDSIVNLVVSQHPFPKSVIKLAKRFERIQFVFKNSDSFCGLWGYLAGAEPLIRFPMPEGATRTWVNYSVTVVPILAQDSLSNWLGEQELNPPKSASKTPASAARPSPKNWHPVVDSNHDTLLQEQKSCR